ncbi:MAG: SLOG family protein [Acutalibacteraceae bacterium]|nr:SLOG family protein [Acutalibacteraceae bacterium]
MKVKKVCCFTGHRPQKLPFGFNEADERCVLLKHRIREKVEYLITEQGVTHFIVGMALGVDIYSAEIVLSLKEKYPQVTLECAIPCETQCVKWSEPMRDRYFDIVSKCDKETLLQTHYTNHCMQKRNEYMVNSSDYIIAVWDGKPSGTGNTVRYAESKGKTIITIKP